MKQLIDLPKSNKIEFMWKDFDADGGGRADSPASLKGG
jgi:hypothetical protein